MPYSTYGLLIAIGLASAAPPARADTPGDPASAVRARLQGWRKAFNARNAAGACDLFAPDLEYSVPDIPRGTFETMCGNFGKLFAKPGLKLSYAEPAIHEILIAGDHAIVRLTWTLTTEASGEAETTTEEGMDIFARQPDGRWSIKRFIAF